MLEILKYPNPKLREKAKVVKDFKNLNSLLVYLKVTCLMNKGTGLACPQVGINKQIFIFDTGVMQTIINPKILKTKGKIVIKEGCLSVPNEEIFVKRFQKIWVEYKNVKGKTKHTTFENLDAAVFQHEYDHLKGKLIVDYK